MLDDGPPPPVGTTLFVGCAIGKISIEHAARHLWPFWLAMLVVLLLVTYIPALASVAAFSAPAKAADITFHGASQFDETHAFTQLMRKFESLTKLYYAGDKTPATRPSNSSCT